MFLPANNCFHHISFGRCERSIYGATLANFLHIILFGLGEHIVESIELMFTHLAMGFVSRVVVSIYENSRKHSESDLPDQCSFRHGLRYVKL